MDAPDEDATSGLTELAETLRGLWSDGIIVAHEIERELRRLLEAGPATVDRHPAA
jgi:hypothetical protein